MPRRKRNATSTVAAPGRTVQPGALSCREQPAFNGVNPVGTSQAVTDGALPLKRGVMPSKPGQLWHQRPEGGDQERCWSRRLNSRALPPAPGGVGGHGRFDSAAPTGIHWHRIISHSLAPFLPGRTHLRPAVTSALLRQTLPLVKIRGQAHPVKASIAGHAARGTWPARKPTWPSGVRDFIARVKDKALGQEVLGFANRPDVSLNSPPWARSVQRHQPRSHQRQR